MFYSFFDVCFGEYMVRNRYGVFILSRRDMLSFLIARHNFFRYSDGDIPTAFENKREK